MEYYLKQNIDENIVQYVFKADDNSLHGICVQKDISQEQALLILESLPNENEQEFPQGLS